MAFFLVPFLLVIGAGGAQAKFVCQMDLVERPACCCPTGAAAATDAPAVKAAGCCDVRIVDAAGAEPRGRLEGSSDASQPAVAFVAGLSVAVAVAPPRARPVTDTSPALGPPRILVKQSFLL